MAADVAPIVIDKGILTDLLPTNIRQQLTPETFQEIVDVNEDVQVLEAYRDNIIGHTYVLRSGNYTLKDYAKACRFVTYLLLGETQKHAYIRTFPDRYKVFKDQGMTDKQISARTSMYAKGKMVVAIREAAEVPVWLANAHNFQRAVNKQVYLMEHADSERVQSDAANSIMVHLKRPDALKVEVEESEQTKSTVATLLSALEHHTLKQLEAVQNGATAKQIIDHKLVEESKQ